MQRRSLRVVALAIGCGLVSAVAAGGQTVGDILDRNQEARGGAALHGVQSVRQTLSVDLLGTNAAVVVYSKRPNLIRQEMRIAGRTLIEAFDGVVAWTRGSLMANDTPMMLPGARAEALRAQAGFDGVLSVARAAGRQVDLVGTVVIDGREAHHLRMVDGRYVRHTYVDARTGLEMRVVQVTAAGRLQQDLSDYRDVGGIRMPFTIRVTVDGRAASVVTVTDVALNVPLDDALFAWPR
jgi:hypothetical protein